MKRGHRNRSLHWARASRGKQKERPMNMAPAVMSLILPSLPPSQRLTLYSCHTLYLGAMKTLSALLSCSKYAELLLIPRTRAQRHNADPDCQHHWKYSSHLASVPRGGGDACSSAVSHAPYGEAAQLMRSPHQTALGLADLERAQSMIYKLVVNGLLEEPSGGKVKPGQ
ncbi:unnamed protein product [Lampetra planeri]